jgi:hypothetical protein
MPIVLWIVILLIGGALLSTMWSTTNDAAIRERTSAMVSSCKGVHSKSTICLVLNLPLKGDVPSAVAACFASARCPHKLSVCAILYEKDAVNIDERIRSRLRYMNQPEVLAENFRYSIIYSRVDEVKQCLQDCYRNEAIVCVVQGQTVFVQDFDQSIRHYVPIGGDWIFSQFPPASAHNRAGFPVFRCRGQRRVGMLKSFARESGGLVPISLISGQMYAFQSHMLAHIPFSMLAEGRPLQATQELAKHGLSIVSSSSSLLRSASPQSWWQPTGFFLETASPCTTTFQTWWGLSADPTQDEITSKFGSIDKFEKLSAAHAQPSIHPTSSNQYPG